MSCTPHPEEAVTEAKMSPLCLVLLAALAVVAAAPQKYTAKFDSVNVDQILNNKRLLESYFNCMLDKGPCTPEGEELKKNARDALETGCKKCTQKQKEGTEKVLNHVLKNYRKEFSQLEKKYDPNGRYKARYQEEAKKRGLKL